MVSIGECRRLLGGDAAGLTDEEVAEVREELYRLARIAVDMLDGGKAGGRRADEQRSSRSQDSESSSC